MFRLVCMCIRVSLNIHIDTYGTRMYVFICIIFGRLDMYRVCLSVVSCLVFFRTVVSCILCPVLPCHMHVNMRGMCA